MALWYAVGILNAKIGRIIMHTRAIVAACVILTCFCMWDPNIALALVAAPMGPFAFTLPGAAALMLIFGTINVVGLCAIAWVVLALASHVIAYMRNATLLRANANHLA